MIFQKKNPVPQIYRKRYSNEFEYMFILSKGKVKTHNPIMIDCKHAGLELRSTTYKNYSKSEQKRRKLANPVKNRNNIDMNFLVRVDLDQDQFASIEDNNEFD